MRHKDAGMYHHALSAAALVLTFGRHLGLPRPALESLALGGYGIEILTQCRGVNDTVLTRVRTHHERHDGSGYPLGLKGDSIPAFGKIAGIADA